MHETIVRLAEVWKTCNKIRAAVFRVGLNLWDWYLPLDPEKNCLISESKFVSVLAGPLRSVVGLSDQEISQLTDYFRTQDGRILYHQLCQLIHGEDTTRPQISQTDNVLDDCPPPPEPACHQMDDWQLRRLCTLLATIAQRQLPLKPYFQDYELVSKNDGRVTFAHFSRLLNYVGVLVSSEDFNLLVRRFIKDSYTIDYVEFLKAVEAVRKEGIRGLGPQAQNPATILDTTLPKSVRPEIGGPVPAAVLGGAENFHPSLKAPRPERDLVEIMMRIQETVKQRRIRVSEFFRDYDPLNCGRISPTQFRRALDTMGLGGLLTPKEMLCILRQYLDPNDGDKICWRTFEDDCDQVFTVKELEKHPDLKVGATQEAVDALPRPGSLEIGSGPMESELDMCEAALMRIKRAITERALDLRPPFRDHDEHNNGHVSRAQVRRVLARMAVLPTQQQLLALEARYLDDCGFNYHKLFDDLGEISGAKDAVTKDPRGPILRPLKQGLAEPWETDIVQILAKIKGKIVREGIRPMHFLEQHDPHKELVISRADFYRSLGTAGLALTPIEMDTLMEVFAAPGRRRFVEYFRFCEVIGEALTQGGLERAPLLEPVPHVPTKDTPMNFLNFEERHVVSMALQKLAKFPDQLSNIMEVFKDMDRENCGSIPQSQLERALCQRGLLQLVSSKERDLIYKCFGYRRGCRDEVNYRAFSNALDLLFATAKIPC